jgi:hypothetical protein
LVLTCQITVGVGVPLAAAVKVACCPRGHRQVRGFCVTTGAEGPEVTVSVATVVVAVPAELVNLARKQIAVVEASVVKVSVVDVAQAMS